MTLLYYESVFSGLNLHMAGARVSPHKVAMLLAVMDLVEDGTLTDNRIEYSKSLTAAFQERFRELGTEGDSSRAIYPYFQFESGPGRYALMARAWCEPESVRKASVSACSGGMPFRALLRGNRSSSEGGPFGIRACQARTPQWCARQDLCSPTSFGLRSTAGHVSRCFILIRSRIHYS